MSKLCKHKADYSSTVNLCALRHVDMEPPRRPRPSMNHEKASDSWTPYPKQMDPIPSHLSCSFHRWCDLCCIMINITRTFFNWEAGPSPSDVMAIGKNIERQLQGWYANLPDCLRVRETTVPHILSLQYVCPIVPIGAQFRTLTHIFAACFITQCAHSFTASFDRRRMGIMTLQVWRNTKPAVFPLRGTLPPCLISIVSSGASNVCTSRRYNVWRSVACRYLKGWNFQRTAVHL